MSALNDLKCSRRGSSARASCILGIVGSRGGTSEISATSMRPRRAFRGPVSEFSTIPPHFLKATEIDRAGLRCERR